MTGKFWEARAEFLAQSGWFDVAWYLMRCPAADASGMEPMAHYLSYGSRAGIGPNAWLDGLRVSPVSCDTPLPGTWGTDGLLRLEMELLEACGLFDAPYYLEHNPDIARKGLDPLEHFCRIGWRELRNPRIGFDVWWYWSCYLDPGRDIINPLLHYALIGRSAGYRGSPRPYSPRAGYALAVPVPRRICLFAGFDPDGIVDEYVIALVRELSQFSEVYYLADCTMSAAELEKLRPYTKGRWAYRHGTYDFGSWAELAAKHVGWDRIEDYDELLLVNDSCYLLNGLAPVFERMRARKCDWWGLQATKGISATRRSPSNQFRDPIPMSEVLRDHLEAFKKDYIYDFLVGSYFLAFRNPVLRDQGFRHRISTAIEERLKGRLVRKCEIGLTQYLLDRQFAFSTFVDELYALPPVYTERCFDILANGFPFLKRLFLVTNHYSIPGLASWKKRVLDLVPGAPVEMIERNLVRVGDHDKLYRSFSIKANADGEVAVPKLMNMRQFERADKKTIRDDLCWAFAVDPFTGTLGSSERAVFEQVRDDPAVTKVVLTRWRKLEFVGESIVVVPLSSPEGQRHLLRAGQVFVSGALPGSLLFPVSECRRNVFCMDVGITGSGFEWLKDPVQLPRWDIIRNDVGMLPEDMQRDVQQLDEALMGRKLLMLVMTIAPDYGTARQMFPADWVERLLTCLRRQGMCLAIRGPGGADMSALFQHLQSRELLYLPERRFPTVELLFRRASIIVTGLNACMAGLAFSGCEVFGFLPNGKDDFDKGAHDALKDLLPEGRLHLDFPHLCRSLEEFMETLPARSVAAPLDSSVADPRNSLVTGESNARRIVRQIRQGYAHELTVSGEPSS